MKKPLILGSLYVIRTLKYYTKKEGRYHKNYFFLYWVGK